MTTTGRILGNSALLGALEAAGQLVNLAMVVLLTRRYGLEALGVYSFAMALGVLLATLAGLGATSYATREMARDPARAAALLAALAPPQRLAVLGGIVVLALWSVSALAPAAAMAIALVASSHLLTRLTNLYLAPSMAGERFQLVAWLGFGERGLALAVFAALAGAGLDFDVACLALPAAALIALLIAHRQARRDLPGPWPRATPAASRTAVRAALPFLWTLLISTFYQRGGLLLLTAIAGTAAAGVFAAGERLLVPCAMLYGSFASAAFPAYSRLAHDAPRLQELATRCLRIVLLSTAALAAMLAVLAPQLVQLVWDLPVPEAVPVLRVLAIDIVLRASIALLSIHCQALGAEARAAHMRTAMLLAFVLLALPASALAGSTGLAVAMLASDLALVAGLWVLLRRQQHQGPTIAILLRPLLAAALAAWACTLLPPLPLPALAATAAGTIAAALLLSGSLRLQDFRLLRDLLRDRSPA
ncbi:MAG: oligosaccharide flippase family protein [Steroidobacteraceae bacterium]|nr:oligosaccharide flippase family protein [Nevskiaceae bacterium]MCP5472474.1 oligosaccharide flippase family protein [Nevskiaceae bacterium]